MTPKSPCYLPCKLYVIRNLNAGLAPEGDEEMKIIKRSDLAGYKVQGYTIEHRIDKNLGPVGMHFFRVLDKDGTLIARTRVIDLRRV